jgi:hypothetical protein
VVGDTSDLEEQWKMAEDEWPTVAAVVLHSTDDPAAGGATIRKRRARAVATRLGGTKLTISDIPLDNRPSEHHPAITLLVPQPRV